MSDYHGLKQKLDKTEWSTVFHYTVPSGTNYSSITYVECVRRDKSPEDSIVPNLLVDDATEHAKVLAGEVYEDAQLMIFEEGASNAEKLAATEARWTEMEANFQANVPIAYKFYGAAGDVP